MGKGRADDASPPRDDDASPPRSGKGRDWTPEEWAEWERHGKGRAADDASLLQTTALRQQAVDGPAHARSEGLGVRGERDTDADRPV